MLLNRVFQLSMSAATLFQLASAMRVGDTVKILPGKKYEHTDPYSMYRYDEGDVFTIKEILETFCIVSKETLRLKLLLSSIEKVDAEKVSPFEKVHSPSKKVSCITSPYDGESIPIPVSIQCSLPTADQLVLRKGCHVLYKHDTIMSCNAVKKYVISMIDIVDNPNGILCSECELTEVTQRNVLKNKKYLVKLDDLIEFMKAGSWLTDRDTPERVHYRNEADTSTIHMTCTHSGWLNRLPDIAEE